MNMKDKGYKWAASFYFQICSVNIIIHKYNMNIFHILILDFL